MSNVTSLSKHRAKKKRMSQNRDDRVSQLEDQVSRLTETVSDLSVDLKIARRTLKKLLKLVKADKSRTRNIGAIELQSGGTE